MTIKQAYEIFFGKTDLVHNQTDVVNTINEQMLKVAFKRCSQDLHPDYSHKMGIPSDKSHLIYIEVQEARRILLACLKNDKSNYQNLQHDELEFDKLSDEQIKQIHQNIYDRLNDKAKITSILNEIKAMITLLNNLKQLDPNSQYFNKMNITLDKAKIILDLQNADTNTLIKLHDDVSKCIEEELNNRNKGKNVMDKQKGIDEYFEFFIKYYLNNFSKTKYIITTDVLGLNKITDIYKNYLTKKEDRQTIEKTYKTMQELFINLPLSEEKIFSEEETKKIKDRIFYEIIENLKVYNSTYQQRTGRWARLPTEFVIAGFTNINILYNEEELEIKKRSLISYGNLIELYLLLDVASIARTEQVNLFINPEDTKRKI